MCSTISSVTTILFYCSNKNILKTIIIQNSSPIYVTLFAKSKLTSSCIMPISIFEYIRMWRPSPIYEQMWVKRCWRQWLLAITQKYIEKTNYLRKTTRPYIGWRTYSTVLAGDTSELWSFSKLDSSKLCEFCIYRVFLTRTSLIVSVYVLNCGKICGKICEKNGWKSDWK